MTDAKKLIEVSDLVKSYGPVRALHGVSFSVDEGTVLGFLGPNGAGKSTTLRILAGFLPGDSGHVRVAGHDVRTESLAVRSAIGYLPEGVPVYPDLRVIEYLRFRARLKGVPRRDRARLIDKALAATEITDVRRRMIHTLSRGYRQRVGLADALLAEPAVLILDEPTVGLDPSQVRQFRELLRNVGRERTVILSTHILSEVELVCSDVVIIVGGKIVARDTAEGIRARSGGRFSVIADLSGEEGLVRSGLRSLNGVAEVEVSEAEGSFRRYRVSSFEVEVDPEAVFAFAREKGLRLRHLERETQTLEDVFLDIVAQGAADGLSSDGLSSQARRGGGRRGGGRRGGGPSAGGAARGATA